MATLMTQHVMGQMGELRFQPTVKRIRALAHGEAVADTTDAVLVWEPRRILPHYAFPIADVKADLVDAPVDGLRLQGGCALLVVRAGRR
jgi:uncharacterized protein (DUF427 family)